MAMLSKYLLDTNVCIGIMNGRPWAVDQVQKFGVEQLYLCTPVKAELWYGACKSQRTEDNQKALNVFFAQLNSLPFDDAVVECLGSLRADLSKKGQLDN